MHDEEGSERKQRPWIIAIIAVVTVIAASMLGFRAFNSGAYAEAEATPQLAQSDAPQSIGSESGDAQSGEAPSPTPTSAVITKPIPPDGLHEGGQVGAETTALWFVDLWEYTFNTGDTEEFNQICHDSDYCDRFADEIKSRRENTIVIQPLEYTIVSDNTSSYYCYERATGITGVCVELSISEKSAIVQPIHPDDTSHEYTTIHNEKSDGTENEKTLSVLLFVTEQDDGTFVISRFLWLPTEGA